MCSRSQKQLEENNRIRKTRDLVKKIRDIKETFHAKMDTVKDRNGMDLDSVILREISQTEKEKKNLSHPLHVEFK